MTCKWLTLLNTARCCLSCFMSRHPGLWHGETKQPEYKQNLHQLGKFYTDTKAKFPNLFWMETPKQHFDSVDGDYKVPWIGKRKGPFTCQPVQGLSMDADGALHADAGNAVAEFVMQVGAARCAWQV